MRLDELKNKRIALLGLGEENNALAKYFLSHKIEFAICDKKEREELAEKYEIAKSEMINFITGENYLDDLKNYDIVFRTPGIPYHNLKIQEAKTSGVEISSQIKLFMDLCPSPILGVTGTKGKGTTTTLIGEILEASRIRVYVGGNLGTPPISFLDKLSKNDYAVLELSSFQLQDLKKSPHIAVVLDIKTDHLDYHSGQTEYIEAKKMIVENQSEEDYSVINADYLTSFEFAVASPSQSYFFSRRKSVDLGAFVEKGKIVLRTKDKEYDIIELTEIQLRGEHNLENICAAVVASYLAGANVDSIRKTVKNFKGLEHRLELVFEKDGIKYYNDSFSTTPDTTIAAIRSFTEPIILLIGGSEKNADYAKLSEVINQSSVKLIINIGETGKKIIEKINKDKIKILPEIHTLDRALEEVKKEALSGDVVLLSPASASFDQFTNYKERGKLFKEMVINAS